MIANKADFYSPQEYLEGEKNSLIKHEYIRGEVYAMAGASKAHVVITLNIATLLRNHLRGSGCTAYVADMKTRMETANVFYYPDVVVSCDQQDKNTEEDFIRYPCLIVEVLSASTEAFDRGDKFFDYRTIETLEEYVLVSQERMRVEVFRRNSEGNWVLYTYHAGDEVVLSSVGFRGGVMAFYEEVTGLG